MPSMLGLFSHSPRRSRRYRVCRRTSASQVAFEPLENKRLLIVDVSLINNILTLTYLTMTNDATLTVYSDTGSNGSTKLSWTVTGALGTIVTGYTSGSLVDSPLGIAVANDSGISEATNAFTLTLPSGAEDLILQSLTVGSSASPIGTVAITTPTSQVGLESSGAITIYAASNITVNGSITVTDNSSATTGSITLLAGRNIRLTGSDGSSSFIATTNSGTGDSGNITLEAGRDIQLTGGPAKFFSIRTGNSGNGDSGNITLKAGGDIQLTGIGHGVGFIQTGNFGNGASGNITLEAARRIDYATGSVSTQNTGSGSAGTVTVEAYDSSLSTATSASTTSAIQVAASTVTSSQAATSLVAPSLGGQSITMGETRGGAVTVRTRRGLINVAGNVSSAGQPVVFDGPVFVTATPGGRRIDTTGTTSGNVTFTGPVEGSAALAIAAGTGAVSFQSSIGSKTPLGGLRFESAGSVTAAGRVRLNGSNANAFRNGIELFEAAHNVNFTKGGTIGNFRSGQAIQVAAGNPDAKFAGIRVVNSGLPFLGFYRPNASQSRLWFAPKMSYTFSGDLRRATARITGRELDNPGRPTLSGTGRSGDTVTLYANGTPVGSALATDGSWSITSVPLAKGVWNFRVRSLGADGVASGFSAPVVVKIK